MTVPASLIAANVRRAQAQKTRPCKTHGDSVAVCEECVKRFCVKCHRKCPKCSAAPAGKFARLAEQVEREMPSKPESMRDPRLREIRRILTPLGLVAIREHVDSGHWMAIFPMEVANVATSEALGEIVYRMIEDVAKTTPFGSGTLFKPRARFVSFQLK